MKLIQYTNQEKISHVLQWAAGWGDGSKGESAWSYSMKLGGSHALLNGWINNAKLMSTLTRKEMNLINEAREASKNSRRVKGVNIA